MNTLKQATLALFATVILFSSCKKDEEVKDEEVKLLASDIIVSTEGITSYEEETDDDKETSIIVKIGKKLKKDITIEFKITPKDNSSDSNDALQFDDTTNKKLTKTIKVTLKKEKTEIKLKIKRNKAKKLDLLMNVVYIVKITKITGKDIDVSQLKAIELTMKPKKGIPVLTKEQMAIVKKYPYIKNWLGRVQVTTEISVDNQNKDFVESSFPMAPAAKTYTGHSIITLSEKATLDKPVLKMVTNPMGMQEFMWMVFKKQTIENAYLGVPYFDPSHRFHKTLNANFRKIMNATKWTRDSSETFSASLDNLVMVRNASNPSYGHIKFLTWIKDHKHIDDKTPTTYEKQSGDGGYYVDFKYKFSVWDRFLKLKNSDATLKKIYVDRVVGNFSSGGNGLTDPNYHLFGVTLNPFTSEDSWTTWEVSDYIIEELHDNNYKKNWDEGSYDWWDDMNIDTHSSYDATTGKMVFHFNFDGKGFRDWIRVKVTYKKVKK